MASPAIESERRSQSCHPSSLGQEYKKAMIALSLGYEMIYMSEDMFRSKYEELKQRAEAAKSKRSTLQTDHYEE